MTLQQIQCGQTEFKMEQLLYCKIPTQNQLKSLAWGNENNMGLKAKQSSLPNIFKSVLYRFAQYSIVVRLRIWMPGDSNCDDYLLLKQEIEFDEIANK